MGSLELYRRLGSLVLGFKYKPRKPYKDMFNDLSKEFIEMAHGFATEYCKFKNTPIEELDAAEKYYIEYIDDKTDEYLLKKGQQGNEHLDFNNMLLLAKFKYKEATSEIERDRANVLKDAVKIFPLLPNYLKLLVINSLYASDTTEYGELNYDGELVLALNKIESEEANSLEINNDYKEWKQQQENNV